MNTKATKLILFVFILTSSTFILCGQSNISIAEEGHEWTSVIIADIGELVSHLYYEKDTLINDTVFSKISGYSDYLVRENQGKVYLSWIGGEYLGGDYTDEFLRYDFNLMVNDTFETVYPGPTNLDYLEKMLVKNVDYVILENSEQRKRITLEILGDESFEDMIWIEGIGSNYGLDYRSHYMTSLPLYLSCFSSFGQKLYEGPFYHYAGCTTNYPSLEPSVMIEVTDGDIYILKI